jgi:hypothetical protein
MCKIFGAYFAVNMWFYRRKGIKPKDKKEEYLSQIINRLNEVFVTDQLTDKDMGTTPIRSATRLARTSR